MVVLSETVMSQLFCIMYVFEFSLYVFGGGGGGVVLGFTGQVS